MLTRDRKQCQAFVQDMSPTLSSEHKMQERKYKGRSYKDGQRSILLICSSCWNNEHAVCQEVGPFGYRL